MSIFEKAGELRCAKCGESGATLLFSGLMSYAGAKVSPDPSLCPDGKVHQFEKASGEKDGEVAK